MNKKRPFSTESLFSLLTKIFVFFIIFDLAAYHFKLTRNLQFYEADKIFKFCSCIITVKPQVPKVHHVR